MAEKVRLVAADRLLSGIALHQVNKGNLELHFLNPVNFNFEE
jgi:hypothetical protein